MAQRAIWDDSRRAFLTSCVGPSFPDEFPHYTLTKESAHFDFVGARCVCVFNYPPLSILTERRGFSCTTAVIRGWNVHPNKSQHRALILEKKILPPFQPEIDPTAFRPRVGALPRSSIRAISSQGSIPTEWSVPTISLQRSIYLLKGLPTMSPQSYIPTEGSIPTISPQRSIYLQKGLPTMSLQGSIPTEGSIPTISPQRSTYPLKGLPTITPQGSTCVSSEESIPTSSTTQGSMYLLHKGL